MLGWAENEKSFITSGPGLQGEQLYHYTIDASEKVERDLYIRI